MLDGLVHVKGKEIAMDNGLELVTGRVVQLNVNGSEQAIQNFSWDDDTLPCGGKGLIPANDQEAILGNGGHVEIPFDVLGVGDFFDGRVPCRRWAWVRRMSGHSACTCDQAVRLVNGNLALPATMSSVEIR